MNQIIFGRAANAPGRGGVVSTRDAKGDVCVKCLSPSVAVDSDKATTADARPVRHDLRREIAKLYASERYHTAAQMAKILGVTKNVILGHAFRMGLRRLAPRKNQHVIQPDESTRHPEGCRYIIGDPKDKDWRYCQADQQQDSPYCPEHHKRCYLPPKVKEDAA